MVAVTPATRERLRQELSRYMRERHLGESCLPERYFRNDGDMTLDSLINYLLDYRNDHRERTKRSNARRTGAKRKPADGQPEGA
jgi:hypothetical protein